MHISASSRSKKCFDLDTVEQGSAVWRKAAGPFFFGGFMELTILNWLQSIRNPFLDRLMVVITTLGNGGWIWIAIAGVLLFFSKTRKCGITILLALILYQLAGNMILKNLVQRPRPFQVYDTVQLLIPKPGEYSFPSGHSGASFAAAAVIAGQYWYGDKKGGWIGIGAGAGALLLAALIAFSRLYLYGHWPTDVLGGILLGVLCAWAAGCACKAGKTVIE